MIVIELLVWFAMMCFIGLMITQFIVPTIKGTETWWLFRGNHPTKNLSKTKVRLENVKTEKEVEAVEKQIKTIRKK